MARKPRLDWYVEHIDFGAPALPLILISYALDGAVNPSAYYLDHFDIANSIQAALDAGIAVPAVTVAIHDHAALDARKSCHSIALIAVIR